MVRRVEVFADVFNPTVFAGDSPKSNEGKRDGMVYKPYPEYVALRHGAHSLHDPPGVEPPGLQARHRGVAQAAVVLQEASRVVPRVRPATERHRIAAAQVVVEALARFQVQVTASRRGRKNALKGAR